MSIHVGPDKTSTTGGRAVATLGRRGLGRLADLALWGGFVLVLSMLTGSDAEGAMTYPVWFYWVLALAPISYEAASIRWRQGQTLGKSWAGIRVATLSGDAPGLMSAVVRSATTWPFLVVAIDDQLGARLQVPAIAIYVVVFAVSLTNRRHRGLHDLAAGTVVTPAMR